MALELASCPGAAIMYSWYACWQSMSHDAIRHGQHPLGMDIIAVERIAEHHML